MHAARSNRKANERRRKAAEKRQWVLTVEEQQARAKHRAAVNARQHEELAARIALEQSRPVAAVSHSARRAADHGRGGRVATGNRERGE